MTSSEQLSPSVGPVADFGLVFISLARKWRQAFNLELSKIGLTETTFAPLVRLDLEGDGITQVELASRLGLDASSLVRQVDLLEQRGLISRRIDPRDRRLRRIFLSQDGRRELLRIRQKLGTVDAQILAGFAQAEIGLLMDQLVQLGARLDEMINPSFDAAPSLDAVMRAPS